MIPGLYTFSALSIAPSQLHRAQRHFYPARAILNLVKCMSEWRAPILPIRADTVCERAYISGRARKIGSARTGTEYVCERELREKCLAWASWIEYCPLPVRNQATILFGFIRFATSGNRNIGRELATRAASRPCVAAKFYKYTTDPLFMGFYTQIHPARKMSVVTIKRCTRRNSTIFHGSWRRNNLLNHGNTLE